jgi:hypothetical protein
VYGGSGLDANVADWCTGRCFSRAADADAQFVANEILLRLKDDESEVVLAALAVITKVIGFLEAEPLFHSLTGLLQGENATRNRAITIAAAKLLATDYVTAHPDMADKVSTASWRVAPFFWIGCGTIPDRAWKTGWIVWCVTMNTWALRCGPVRSAGGTARVGAAVPVAQDRQDNRRRGKIHPGF